MTNEGIIDVEPGVTLLPSHGKTFTQASGEIVGEGHIQFLNGRFNYYGGTIVSWFYTRDATIDVSASPTSNKTFGL